ncbi:pollen-specific leucine-rich repeat extensin-like protein 3 [Rana temporaria]|uniref:pollen-specific leucine-rich repeat extensin-like protein 3 n=1 Tax=Rana temporaria TaxID=8407 RepID=UPI001AAC7DB3|nr:pollen-specific leucine-rich repeat extensin-like protein 3 [Rana temporaria]
MACERTGASNVYSSPPSPTITANVTLPHHHCQCHPPPSSPPMSPFLLSVYYQQCESPPPPSHITRLPPVTLAGASTLCDLKIPRMCCRCTRRLSHRAATTPESRTRHPLRRPPPPVPSTPPDLPYLHFKTLHTPRSSISTLQDPPLIKIFYIYTSRPSTPPDLPYLHLKILHTPRSSISTPQDPPHPQILHTPRSSISTPQDPPHPPYIHPQIPHTYTPTSPIHTPPDPPYTVHSHHFSNMIHHRLSGVKRLMSRLARTLVARRRETSRTTARRGTIRGGGSCSGTNLLRHLRHASSRFQRLT